MRNSKGVDPKTDAQAAQSRTGRSINQQRGDDGNTQPPQARCVVGAVGSTNHNPRSKAMSTTTMKERVTEWRETNPLRIRRKAEGLSLMECASALGAGQSSVQLWENGAQRPGPDAMAAIAKFLGVSVTTATRRWDSWHQTHPSRAA